MRHRILSLTIVFCFVFNTILPVFAISDFSYKETLTPKRFYVVTDSNSAVRSSPNQSSEQVEAFGSGEIFVAKEVTNLKGHLWLRVELENGEYGFIAHEHANTHDHEFVTIAITAETNEEISVCKCGLIQCIDRDGSYISCDVDDVLCQWASGNFSSTTSLEAVALESVSDIALDAGLEMTCNPATISATDGVAGVACAALVTVKAFILLRDLTADLANQDSKNLFFDIAGTYVNAADLLEVMEINRAVKHSDLYDFANAAVEVNDLTTILEALDGESVEDAPLMCPAFPNQ